LGESVGREVQGAGVRTTSTSVGDFDVGRLPVISGRDPLAARWMIIGVSVPTRPAVPLAEGHGSDHRIRTVDRAARVQSWSIVRAVTASAGLRERVTRVIVGLGLRRGGSLGSRWRSIRGFWSLCCRRLRFGCSGSRRRGSRRCSCSGGSGGSQTQRCRTSCTECLLAAAVAATAEQSIVGLSSMVG